MRKLTYLGCDTKIIPTKYNTKEEILETMLHVDVYFGVEVEYFTLNFTINKEGKIE